MTPEQFIALWKNNPLTERAGAQAWFDDLGGPFGTLLIYSHDYIDAPEAWEHSMDLLVNEVAPRLETADVAVAA